ncbi:unnamed protein product [Leptidea sinapis]|uniref:Uncharacterized protein n=1 Tax=Leptidea sinapis TaxID=189913 RepID=A0A5E4PQ53_9NEOP|nr:unnamed protein product [Leptidea sinapis]
MSESIFDIFGDLTRQTTRNTPRQPLFNTENIGKTVSSGPYKPNEPVKKNLESKKSFLCNTGKAFQSTPVRKVFTPGTVNVGSVIYNDEKDGYNLEDIEFTKPSYKYDNYNKDMFDFLLMPEVQVPCSASPPNTPPPAIKRPNDISFDSIPEEELGLPDIF